MADVNDILRVKAVETLTPYDIELMSADTYGERMKDEAFRNKVNEIEAARPPRQKIG